MFSRACQPADVDGVGAAVAVVCDDRPAVRGPVVRLLLATGFVVPATTEDFAALREAVSTHAACVAVVWSVAAYRASRPAGTERVKVAVVNDAPAVAPVAVAAAPEEPIPVLESATWSPVVDEGLGLVDNQPVRKLRRDVVEEVEWFDPRHKAVVRTTTPKQQIFLIDVKTD